MQPAQQPDLLEDITPLFGNREASVRLRRAASISPWMCINDVPKAA